MMARRPDGERPVRVRFGELTFDSTSRQLVRDGREIHLSLKAFELLKCLLERRPEAISKESLQSHLWPDTFVSEANLPSLVAEIRTAIDDTARKPRFIRTVHGFGYAFSGSAEDLADRLSAAPRAKFVLVWERRQLVLHEGDNVVGRDDDADVSFDSPTLSRRHCRLRISGQEVTIEDLGSKNGTYVRDERITSSVRLADGDRLRVGSFLLTLRASQRDVSTRTQTTSGDVRRRNSKN
jgi:DNA-binding winged helix-turn-helix (wHTH) protein